MQPQQQQQTVITQPAVHVVHPPYVSQPYIVESYRHVHSNIIGILLIVAGAVNILLSIIEIIFSSIYHSYEFYYYTGVSGYGVFCGAWVSGLDRKCVRLRDIGVTCRKEKLYVILTVNTPSRLRSSQCY